LIRSPESLLVALSGRKISAEASEQELNEVKAEILHRYQARAQRGEIFTQGSLDFIQALASTHSEELRLSILDSRFFKRLFKEVYGYEVIDMPGFGEVRKSKIFLGTNAILSGSFALVPHNDFLDLDQMIEKVYQNLGYEVIPMESSILTILKWGGIRCASGTYRKPYLEYLSH
jgi:hypothetical protein